MIFSKMLLLMYVEIHVHMLIKQTGDCHHCIIIVFFYLQVAKYISLEMTLILML